MLISILQNQDML